MKEMWDQRFAGEEYAYGTQPNLFFREKILCLEPGVYHKGEAAIIRMYGKK